MAQSKTEPEPTPIQGKCLLPCNVHEIQVDNEDGTTETHYEYEEAVYPEQYIPPFDIMRDHVVSLLRNRVNAFIDSYYDQGTQNTIQSYALRAVQNGYADIYDACNRVMAWTDDVLAYYDVRKQDMLNATDMQTLKWIQWNFENDVAPSSDLPGWRDIKAMFP